MKDTLEVLKNIITNPVAYVNGGVILGLSSMQWDLVIKILITLPTVIWTWFKVYNEIKVYKAKKSDEVNRESKLPRRKKL